MALKAITFFQRFEEDILSGKKTITIRDASEKDFEIGSIVPVSTLETDRWFCDIRILDVTPVTFDMLSDFHAQQENMSLPQLKTVIRDIYPDIDELFVISYELV